MPVATSVLPSHNDIRERNPSVTIYLHIGLHKTGTTTIQNLLRHNQDILARGGALYLRTGRISNGHHGLAQSLVLEDGTRFQAAIHDVKAEIDRAYSEGISTILISSEVFCRVGVNNLHRLRQALSSYDVKVVAFFRRQDEMAVSHYCEFVKRGHVSQDFPDFVARWHVDRLLYWTFHQRLQRVFGAQSVNIASYNMHSSDIFGKFCCMAEIAWLLSAPGAVLEGRANPALDRHLLKCLFYLRLNWRQEGHDVETFESQYLIPFANFINQRFPERPREPFHGFGEHLAQKYMARFKDENHDLSTSYLEVEDAFPSRKFYPPVVESLLPSTAEASEINKLVLSFLKSYKGPDALTALSDGR